jgi:hypothetical protein
MRGLLSTGERIAGQYPWLFTVLYIFAIALVARLLGLMTDRDISLPTILSIAAMHMAVEARYGHR